MEQVSYLQASKSKSKKQKANGEQNMYQDIEQRKEHKQKIQKVNQIPKVKSKGGTIPQFRRADANQNDAAHGKVRADEDNFERDAENQSSRPFSGRKKRRKQINKQIGRAHV